MGVDWFTPLGFTLFGAISMLVVQQLVRVFDHSAPVAPVQARGGDGAGSRGASRELESAFTFPGPGPAVELLTVRELEIAEMVAAGKHNGEIAQELHLSPHTVGTHVKHIYAKLGINSRVQLVHWMRGAAGQSFPR